MNLKTCWLPLLLGALAQTACAERAGSNDADSDTAAKPVQLALENPGFEEPGGEMNVPGWSLFQHAGDPSYVMTLDRKSPGKGKQSLRLTQILPQVYAVVEQRADVTPDMVGKMVEFSALAKTSEIGATGWSIWIYLYDGSEHLIADYRSTRLLGTTKWQRVVAVGKIPPRTAKFTIGVQMDDRGNHGIGWLDDVQLRVFEPGATAEP